MSEFLLIAGVHLLAVASPGPDFAVTVRQAVKFGRREGILTACGIGAGIAVHVAYCACGLAALISSSVVLFNAAKYLGALYLVYLGIGALLTRQPAEVSENGEKQTGQVSTNSFAVGFITNVLNPKATLFFLSLFTVVVSADTPLLTILGYGLWMIFATTLWFAGVATLVSNQLFERGFKRAGVWFERVTGVVLVALGAKLALSRFN